MKSNSDYNIPQLAADLRALFHLEITEKADLKQWYETANKIEDRMVEADLHNTLPEYEFIFHYLSDADIRLRDPDYKRMHDEEMTTLLNRLQNQTTSESRS